MKEEVWLDPEDQIWIHCEHWDFYGEWTFRKYSPKERYIYTYRVFMPPKMLGWKRLGYL